jgi:hypothetical protein
MKNILLASLISLIPGFASAAYWDGNPSARPVAASSVDVANGQVQVTLPAVAGQKNYLTFVHCSGDGATASTSVNATITGLLGGTIHMAIVVPAKTTDTNWRASMALTHPWPASAPNTPIVVTVPALGAGNLHSSCTMLGMVSP